METLTVTRDANGNVQVTGQVSGDAAALVLIELAKAAVMARIAAPRQQQRASIIQAQAIPNGPLRPSGG